MPPAQADIFLATLNNGFQSNSDDADFLYFDKTSAENLPATFENAQKMIIELKFIANFFSLENYNDYRRTHYPVVVLPIDAQYSNVPVRLPYATSTKLCNKDNVSPINFVSDKIWWDKK